MACRSCCALASVALGLVVGLGCGAVGAPDGGPNAPCTRSSDCGGALVCLEGVCRDRVELGDAGSTEGNGPPDAGTDDDADAAQTDQGG